MIVSSKIHCIGYNLLNMKSGHGILGLVAYITHIFFSI